MSVWIQKLSGIWKFQDPLTVHLCQDFKHVHLTRAQDGNPYSIQTYLQKDDYDTDS